MTQTQTPLPIGTRITLSTIGGVWTVVGQDRNGSLVTCPDSTHTLIIGGSLTSCTYKVVQ